MKRKASARGAWRMRWFHALGAMLFVSGAAWVAFDRLAEQEVAHKALFRSLKPWSLELHGAAAMAFLVALGILIPTHIQPGWRRGEDRGNGVALVSVVVVLVSTGYGLYYLGDERWRLAASWIHLSLGLASPLLLVWHIRHGRRKQQASRPQAHDRLAIAGRRAV